GRLWAGRAAGPASGGHAGCLRVLAGRWAGHHRGLVLGAAGAVRGVAIPGGAGAPAGGDGRLRRGRAGAVRPRPRAPRARSPANTPAPAPATSLAFANFWMLCPPLISPATAGTGEPYHPPR